MNLCECRPSGESWVPVTPLGSAWSCDGFSQPTGMPEQRRGYPEPVLTSPSIVRLRRRLPLIVFILLAILCLLVIGFACACFSDHHCTGDRPGSVGTRGDARGDRGVVVRHPEPVRGAACACAPRGRFRPGVAGTAPA